MKKIDIFMSDVLLKVNVTELKMIKILDLKYEITLYFLTNTNTKANR